MLDDKNIPQDEWENELVKYYPIYRKAVFDALSNKEFLETLKEKIDEAVNKNNPIQEGKCEIKKHLIRKAERDSRCEILVKGAKQITEVGLDTIKEAYEALNNNMTREEVDAAYKKLKSATHSIEYSWEQLAKNSDLFDIK